MEHTAVEHTAFFRAADAEALLAGAQEWLRGALQLELFDEAAAEEERALGGDDLEESAGTPPAQQTRPLARTFGTMVANGRALAAVAEAVLAQRQALADGDLEAVSLCYVYARLVREPVASVGDLVCERGLLATQDIAAFLDAAKALGVPDHALADTVDVIKSAESQDASRRTCLMLRSFAQRCEALGLAREATFSDSARSVVMPRAGTARLRQVAQDAVPPLPPSTPDHPRRLSAAGSSAPVRSDSEGATPVSEEQATPGQASSDDDAEEEPEDQADADAEEEPEDQADAEAEDEDVVVEDDASALVFPVMAPNVLHQLAPVLAADPPRRPWWGRVIDYVTPLAFGWLLVQMHREETQKWVLRVGLHGISAYN